MNKVDLANVRKNFKINENSQRLEVHKIYDVICQSKSFLEVYEGGRNFFDLDENEQEKYVLSFKKLLMGGIDKNLFNLEFKKDGGAIVQKELLALRDSRLGRDEVLELTRKIVETGTYGADVLLTFITATVIITTKSQKKSKDEDDSLEGFEYDMLMCMVSQLNPKQPLLVLDKDEKSIRIEKNISLLDVKKPIEGFTFPCYNDGYIDVNSILYHSNKADEPNIKFINDVLACENKLTSKTQKEVFNAIIKTAVGEKVDVETLSSIYKDIEEESKGSKDGTISTQSISRVLVQKGLGTAEKIKEAIATTIKKQEAELTVENIIPTKNIKLKNHSITVSLPSEELGKVVQKNVNGKKCLIIELDEDMDLDELILKTVK